MTGKGGRLHGLLIIDKPAGWTSHDVVARVRRITGERRVGHAGTLDPSATGVLPVAVGDATRLLEYLSEADKTYVAEVTFGVETDSYDADGTVTRWDQVPAITEQDLGNALVTFRGPILQTPPMYSAIKIKGQKLYDLARQGIEIERPQRGVTIHELSLISWKSPSVTLCIDCSKGTYIRSLAKDLGASLGTLAHLSNLIRLRTGPFTLADAWTMEELANRPVEEEWAGIALHPDEAAAHLPAMLLDEHSVAEWRFGRLLPALPPDVISPIRAYDDAGNFAGIGVWKPEQSAWAPKKVFGNAA